MSCDFYGQPVVRRSDTTRQLRFQLSVTGAMGEVGEPGLTRADPLCRAHCFRYAQVSWMLGSEEGVQNEDIDTSKGLNRVVGKLLGVGDVSEVADTVPIYRDWPVRNGYRQNVHITNAKCLPGRNRVRPSLRLARAGQRFYRVVEDVGEAFCQSRH